MYRLKEMVERDFRTIKSVVKVRPIYHYTPAKVRAHVTLCALALLVERAIERTLAAVNRTPSAPAAFEELATCHLNLYTTNDDHPLYTLTSPTPMQRTRLRALNMKVLGSEADATRSLHPRPFVPTKKQKNVSA